MFPNFYRKKYIIGQKATISEIIKSLEEYILKVRIAISSKDIRKKLLGIINFNKIKMEV